MRRQASGAILTKLYTIVYRVVNYRGLARMHALALQYEEVRTSRLDRPPRGPHVREANWVRAIYLHQRALHHGNLSQAKFAEMADITLGAFNKWIEGRGRLRSDSVDKLQRLAPGGLTSPIAALALVGPVASESGRSYEPSDTQRHGGSRVRTTTESDFLTRVLNQIEDDDERAEAMLRAVEAIRRNPQPLGVSGRPPPARRP